MERKSEQDCNNGFVEGLWHREAGEEKKVIE
jgi:hypothetical protein